MNTPKTTFTPQQLEDWKKYERVRQGGRFNMFDPRARQLTGMSREDYMFCLKNYSELKSAVEEQDKR